MRFVSRAAASARAPSAPMLLFSRSSLVSVALLSRAAASERALIADGSTSTFAVLLLGTVGTVVIAELGWNLLFLFLLLLLFPATALWGRRALRCAGDASTRGSALVYEQ